MNIDLTYTTRGGRELTVAFPAKFEVCPRCEGKGKHTNPSIDGNGLTREDFDRDPDFRDNYFSGVYDVPCDTCDGERVVPEVDEDRLTARQTKRYAIVQAQIDEAAREDRADWHSERFLRMAECGERF